MWSEPQGNITKCLLEDDLRRYGKIWQNKVDCNLNQSKIRRKLIVNLEQVPNITR